MFGIIRERLEFYALDNDSEDGYRKLSKDEELDILQQEFEEFTESRFGKKQQEAAEMVNKQMEELQKFLREAERAVSDREHTKRRRYRMTFWKRYWNGQECILRDYNSI